ncbi:MAG TPA: hypothetical protein ENG70_02590 [Candidatus Cloacimonetes bacterium]|nr:hypothetical protein [Candidatus Cloacimonadota bacterium]HEX37731.1 hypothetical protein [Candidatus Cloacimonadota bacterium]
MNTYKVINDDSFQLLYLALLTSGKVKPLSRWEKGLDHQKKKMLQRFDLSIEPVTRICANGKKLHEFVFSKSARYSGSYREHFNNRILQNTQEDKRIEGFFFGYPSCCVENFIHHGYSYNPYIGKEQNLFFHWICPNCRITPSLVPLYTSIFQEAYDLFESEYNDQRTRFISKVTRKALPYAAAVTFLLSISNPLRADTHWLPVPGDNDNDYMNNSEELITGVFPSGETHSIAQSYTAIIDSLPRGVVTDSCYVIEHPAYGFYNCPICGESHNMGYITVHNPMHELEIEIPYMALHFMEHGSFSYVIENDTSRLDISLLDKTLAPLDTLHHSLITPDDTDNDGLNDTAEQYFDMEINDPYTHDIGIDDGHEISQLLIERISELPVIENGTPPPDSIYIETQQVYGIEDCTICGRTQNMGFAIIHNPLQGTSITFPFMGLHYMSHGRFVYEGTTNQGEIDPIELCELLEMDLAILEEYPEFVEKYGYEIIHFPNPYRSNDGILTLSIQLENTCKNSVYEIDNINIYSLKGGLIKTIDILNHHDNEFTVLWNGKDSYGEDVSSGIYIIKAEVNGSKNICKKVVLIR